MAKKKGKTVKTVKVKQDPMEIDDKENKVQAKVEDDNGLRSTIRRTGEDGKQWIQTCPYCSEEFFDPVTHIKASHKGKPWRGIKTACPIENCGKDIVDIRNHIRLVHEKIRNFPCNLCHLAFSNSSSVRIHINAVHKGLKKKCPHCNLVVKENYLKEHIRKIHEGRNERVKCSAGCDKTYTCKADMDRHVLRVHLKYKVKCEYCEKQFNPDQMSRHVRKAHQGVYNFYCNTCQAGFDTEKSLRLHTSINHTGIFALCNVPKPNGELCQMKLRTEEGCYEHIKKHLLKDKLVKCKDCNTEVYSCYLNEHTRILHTKEPIECSLQGCTASFKQRSDLSKHFLEAHPNIMEHLEWCCECKRPVFYLSTHTKMFHDESDWTRTQFKSLCKIAIGLMCKEDGCKFFAVNKGALSRHTRFFHEKPTQFQCDVCLKRVSDLEEHRFKFHSVDKVHICQICTKGFTTSRALATHVSKHNKKKETCPHCHKEIVNLKQHISSVHLEIKNFKCDVENCTTTFVTNLAKRKHMLHVHEGFRFKCEICSKEVSNLKGHIRLVHEKVRSHTCPECGKSFQAKSHLRNHIARVHLKIREKCPDCGKMVQDMYSHNLYVHKKTRNFPCDQCNTRCSTSTTLRLHIKSVHLGEKAKCEGCNFKFTVGYLRKHRTICPALVGTSEGSVKTKKEED